MFKSLVTVLLVVGGWITLDVESLSAQENRPVARLRAPSVTRLSPLFFSRSRLYE